LLGKKGTKGNTTGVKIGGADMVKKRIYTLERVLKFSLGPGNHQDLLRKSIGRQVAPEPLHIGVRETCEGKSNSVRISSAFAEKGPRHADHHQRKIRTGWG